MVKNVVALGAGFSCSLFAVSLLSPENAYPLCQNLKKNFLKVALTLYKLKILRRKTFHTVII